VTQAWPITGLHSPGHTGRSELGRDRAFSLGLWVEGGVAVSGPELERRWD
jgi:hypothetical protein